MAAGDYHSPPYICQDLANFSNIWMRIDRVYKSLEAPYSCSCDVLDRHPNTIS